MVIFYLKTNNKKERKTQKCRATFLNFCVEFLKIPVITLFTLIFMKIFLHSYFVFTRISGFFSLYLNKDLKCIINAVPFMTFKNPLELKTEYFRAISRKLPNYKWPTWYIICLMLKLFPR